MKAQGLVGTVLSTSPHSRRSAGCLLPPVPVPALFHSPPVHFLTFILWENSYSPFNTSSDFISSLYRLLPLPVCYGLNRVPTPKFRR